MKRKSSKAWIIIAVIIAMLVLVCAMVGCKPKPPVDNGGETGVDTAEALGKVITAADNTLGKIKNSNGDLSLGLSIGVKGTNLKLNIDEKDVQVNIGKDEPINFDAKVKIGANLSETTDNNEILAEVMVGNAVKFGVYSKDNVVYVQDGVTTTETKKIKVSGAQAVGYNQYLDDLPAILKGAVKDLDISDLGKMIGNFKSLINGLIKTTESTNGYKFDIVFVSEKENEGLGPILQQLGSSLKFGEPFDGLIATYLPYILGGNFDDFSKGTVKTTSKITLDVGIKDNMLTGVDIGIDLDPLKSIKDVGGQINISIGDLVIDNKKTDVLPKDLDKYEEGAVTANLALDIPNSPKDLKLFAKIEFSPSLKDEDLKVSVVAKDKDGKEIGLEGGYVKLDPDGWAVVFDIGALYDIAEIADQKPANTKYKYVVNNGEGLGLFLKNLITSQRVFVFFDDDRADWTNSEVCAEFFVENGKNVYSKAVFDKINERVKAYYLDEFGITVEDKDISYRYGNAPLWDSDGNYTGNKCGTYALKGSESGSYTGDLTSRKAELGYNLELTVVVNVPDEREFVEVTYTNGTASKNKTVVVRVEDGFVNLGQFAPEYTVDEGKEFKGWKIGESEDMLDSLNVALPITEDTTVTFTTVSVGDKQKVVFKKYDMNASAYVDYVTGYYEATKVTSTVDNKTQKNGIVVTAGSLPAVPEIFGMKGKWIVASDQGYSVSRKYSAIVLSDENDGSFSTFVDKNVVNVYPVYEVDENADWTTAIAVKELEDRFTRKTLHKGVLTSIVEAGDPSLVGQGAVNTILGSLGDIFDIIRNQSVDANFVAKIMGAISPYLGSNKLIADRIISAFVDSKAYPTVQYPYEMPSLKNGDATVNAASVAVIGTDSDLLKASESQPTNLTSAFLNRCQNATIWATYQRFVGKYGNGDEDAAKAYVEDEEANYDAKVAAAQAKFDEAKKKVILFGKETDAEAFVLSVAAGIFGDEALDGATTLEEFIFGKDGKSPLVVALDFAEPTKDSGYGVTIKLMRGKTLIASVSGDVFFSYASEITGVKASDYAGAMSIHEVANPGDKLSIVVTELEKIGKAMLGVSDEKAPETEEPETPEVEEGGEEAAA